MPDIMPQVGGSQKRIKIGFIISSNFRTKSNTASYVDQGGNKRSEAFAIYLEPWYADIFNFLDLRKNHEAASQGLILCHVDPYGGRSQE